MAKTRYTNFHDDLKLGTTMEKYIAKICPKLFKGCTDVEFNNNKDYDLRVKFAKTPSVDIEVKYDKYANKSGNLCFELYDRKGNLSGIMVTKANIMLFVLTKNLMYSFSVPELYQFVHNHLIDGKYRVVKGGDHSAFEMMLVPIDEMTKQTFCKRIDVR
ncbi:MAG: hypothetical protein MN733_12460 [Nitrososphaera sp.]|nr:hypothetical protein [Nitrososphaera sp.]